MWTKYDYQYKYRITIDFTWFIKFVYLFLVFEIEKWIYYNRQWILSIIELFKILSSQNTIFSYMMLVQIILNLLIFNIKKNKSERAVHFKFFRIYHYYLIYIFQWNQHHIRTVDRIEPFCKTAQRKEQIFIYTVFSWNKCWASDKCFIDTFVDLFIFEFTFTYNCTFIRFRNTDNIDDVCLLFLLLGWKFCWIML